MLTDSEPEDEPAGHNPSAPARGGSGDRGGPVKLTLPASPHSGSGDAGLAGPDDPIPSEPLKTLLSALFLGTGFVATTASLAITHESVPEIEPLPDVILDNVAYQQWGLSVSEILIMISTITACLVVLLHCHRLDLFNILLSNDLLFYLDINVEICTSRYQLSSGNFRINTIKVTLCIFCIQTFAPS